MSVQGLEFDDNWIIDMQCDLWLQNNCPYHSLPILSDVLQSPRYSVQYTYTYGSLPSVRQSIEASMNPLHCGCHIHYETHGIENCIRLRGTVSLNCFGCKTSIWNELQENLWLDKIDLHRRWHWSWSDSYWQPLV